MSISWLLLFAWIGGETLRIGIHGFGRIGRRIAHLAQDRNIDLEFVSDLNPDPKNVAYTYNYDSVYGSLGEGDRWEVVGGGFRKSSSAGSSVSYFSQGKISGLDCSAIDVLIDASGQSNNERDYRELVQGFPKLSIVVTHDHPGVDRIMGNVAILEPRLRAGEIVSAGTCDGAAVAPLLSLFDSQWSIRVGQVTTAHPWLSYQNLSDGPSKSWSSPGSIYDEYALGRSAQPSIIPKSTTATDVAKKMAGLHDLRLTSFSYRVPTAIVSSAVLHLALERTVSYEEIRDKLYPRLESIGIPINSEPLVSIDYVGNQNPATVDGRWTSVLEDTVNIVLFYDNEAGYAANALRVATGKFHGETSV